MSASVRKRLVVTLFAVFGIVAWAITGLRAAGQHDPGVQAMVIYTAPTANDASVVLPADVNAALKNIGLAHGKVAVSRVESTGAVETIVRDLTPRDTPDGPILKVDERANEAIDKSIGNIETDINKQSASTGNRALFVGLTKMTFAPGVPVYIFSSGLDLSNPVDLRQLAFDVPPSVVVDNARSAGELPAMSAVPVVTFAITPPAGAQEQLRQPQQRYISELWTALLEAGGASRVDFISAPGGPSASTTPAPVVALPKLPGTPIAPESVLDRPGDTICRLSTSTYFAANTPELTSRDATKADLAKCVFMAGPTATFAIDSWTADVRPRNAAGRPLSNPPADITLSNDRNGTIADLLVDMGIDRSRIVRMTGHGNDNQPDPSDPGSEKNRVAIISINQA